MPNHTTNILDVLGSPEDIEAFRKLVETKTKKGEYAFTFNNIVPMPKELEGTTSPPQTAEEKELQTTYTERFGAGNWYDWCIKAWGTKWDAYDARETVPIKGGLRFRFLTAWSLPAEWIARAAPRFPNLKLRDHFKDEDGRTGRYECWTEKGAPQDNYEELSEHDWSYEFDEAYREEYDFIITADPSEVISYLQENQLEFPSLIERALQKIPKKDLPLLIGLGWDSYIEKLLKKGVTHGH